MTATVFDFRRPDALEAARPPEARGLARDDVRILVSSPSGHERARFRDLAAFLPRGTVLVVNPSSALAGSFRPEAGSGPFG